MGSGEKGYALVTGASSGIGLEIARGLAKMGYPLVLVARRTERLERLKAELGVPVVVLPADLGRVDAGARLFEAVEAQGLVVDVLVNNAGHGLSGRFLDMDLGAVEGMFRLNISSLTQLTQLFARKMVARKHGYVLQVASAAAFLPSAYVASYAATKSYVSSFSEALSFELRNTGVSITTLYPGITTTEFNEVAGAKTPWVMNLSILDAATVAKIGLGAMFARRRAVVPGMINKINAILCGVLPRGLVTWAAGWLLERANRSEGSG